MVKHEEVAESFVRGQKLAGTNVFTDGKTIWSYGRHFPISTRINYNTYLFNIRKYSSSTSAHQGYVRYALNGKKVIECNTEEIKRAASNPEEPVIIENTKYSEHLPEILDMLRNYCHSKGLKRFPMKKFKKQISDMVIVEAI